MFPACRCSPERLHHSALYSSTVSPCLLRQRPKHPRSGRLFPRGCSPKHACGGCRLPRSFMRPSQYRKRGELRHKKREFFIKTFFKSHNFLIKRKYGKTPASGWASNLFLHQCRMQNWNWVQEFFWLWQLLLNGQVCITAGYGGGMMMVAQWLGGVGPGGGRGMGVRFCGIREWLLGWASGEVLIWARFLRAMWQGKPLYWCYAYSLGHRPGVEAEQKWNRRCSKSNHEQRGIIHFCPLHTLQHYLEISIRKSISECSLLPRRFYNKCFIFKYVNINLLRS